MGIHKLLATSVAFVTFSLAYSLPQVLSRAQDNPPTEVGFINVSVSTLWTDSTKPRPIDAPALRSPVNIQEWLGSMTTDQFRDLTESSRTQTQALYGTRVLVTDKSDGWYKILVPEQTTPSDDRGYPGWVPSSQVSLHEPLYSTLQDNRPFVQVRKSPTAPLHEEISLSVSSIDVSFNTKLPLVGHIGDVVAVAVPGGLAYFSAEDVAVYDKFEDIPKPKGEDLVKTGETFIDQPYLWGGRSAFALDCSGFTGTLHEFHGISIPRDSGPQAYMEGYGPLVDKSDLAAGDLLFYASNITDAKSIYHVAMYAGDGEMLEAYDAGTPVRRTSMRFGKNYWGARRLY